MGPAARLRESPRSTAASTSRSILLVDAEAGTGGPHHRGAPATRARAAPLARAGARATRSDRYDEGYERGVHDADAAAILEQAARAARDGRAAALPAARARAGACCTGPSLARCATRSRAVHRARAEPGRACATCSAPRRARAGRARRELEIADRRRARRQLELAASTRCSMPSRGALPRRGARRPRRRASSRARRPMASARRLCTASLDARGSRAPRSRTTCARSSAVPGARVRPRARVGRGHSSARRHPSTRAACRRGRGAARHRARARPRAVERGYRRGDGDRAARLSTRASQDGALRARGSTSCSARLDRFRERAAVPASAPIRAAACADRRSASKRRLRLDEFRPRVLTSFVRNQLIDEVYLPLVGDNLAKQIGAAGDEQAHRPDGHAAAHLAARLRQDDADGVRRQPARPRLRQGQRPGARARGRRRSIPPRRPTPPRARRSRRSTSRFEMGNNVMLYLDDIQHTQPGVPAEVHLAVRRPAPDRGRLARPHRAPTICAARSSAW